MAGHAEVLQQHVTGEDIARGHILNSLPVIAHCRACRRLVGVADIDIQRDDAPLEIGMGDDDRVVGDSRGLGAVGGQGRQQFIREKIAAECQELEGLRVNQPAGPIVTVDEIVFPHHFLARRALWIVEEILDQLEDHVIAGHGENQHDHAALAAGDLEFFGRISQMV